MLIKQEVNIAQGDVSCDAPLLAVIFLWFHCVDTQHMNMSRILLNRLNDHFYLFNIQKMVVSSFINDCDINVKPKCLVFKE